MIGRCKPDFVDSQGDEYDCKYYVDKKACTPNGDYGEGWGSEQPPIFSTYQVDCYNARNCPGCGCIGTKTNN